MWVARSLQLKILTLFLTLHSAIFWWKRQKRFHYFKPVGKSYVYQTYQNGSTPASDSCRRQVNPGCFQNTTWHIPTYEWSCPCILGYLGDLDDKIDDMIPAELNASETERKYNITGYAEHTKKENKCVSLSEMHKVFFFLPISGIVKWNPYGEFGHPLNEARMFHRWMFGTFFLVNEKENNPSTPGKQFLACSYSSWCVKWNMYTFCLICGIGKKPILRIPLSFQSGKYLWYIDSSKSMKRLTISVL